MREFQEAPGRPGRGAFLMTTNQQQSGSGFFLSQVRKFPYGCQFPLVLSSSQGRDAMQPAVRCHISDFLEYLRSREKAIAAQAESHWLMRGCPEGSPEVDWFKAESEIDHEFLSQLYLGLPA
jgi:hypothetical protein